MTGKEVATSTFSRAQTWGWTPVSWRFPVRRTQSWLVMTRAADSAGDAGGQCVADLVGRAADRPGYSAGGRVQCGRHSGGSRLGGQVGEVCCHGRLDLRGRFGQAQMVEEHGDGKHGRGRVGNRLARNIRGTAM